MGKYPGIFFILFICVFSSIHSAAMEMSDKPVTNDIDSMAHAPRTEPKMETYLAIGGLAPHTNKLDDFSPAYGIGFKFYGDYMFMDLSLIHNEIYECDVCGFGTMTTNRGQMLFGKKGERKIDLLYGIESIWAKDRTDTETIFGIVGVVRYKVTDSLRLDVRADTATKDELQFGGVALLLTYWF